MEKGREFYKDFDTSSFFQELEQGYVEPGKQGSPRGNRNGRRGNGRNDRPSGQKSGGHETKFHLDATSPAFINHGQLSSGDDEFMTPDEVHSTFNSHRGAGKGRGSRPSFNQGNRPAGRGSRPNGNRPGSGRSSRPSGGRAPQRSSNRGSR
jgi:hypothetical protein